MGVAISLSGSYGTFSANGSSSVLDRHIRRFRRQHRLLGVLTREFSETQTHRPIIGVEGYPPSAAEVPDPLVPAQGYVVRSLCSVADVGSYTELIVGLEMTSPDGGGWNGIDIRYTSLGRDRTLHLDQDLLVCGPAAKVDAAVAPDCSEVTGAANEVRP